MPRFEPFSGLRYDPAIPLDRVIAPPYDIVDAEERARLAERHLANAIHVELPVDDPRTGLDRYQSAAAHLARWIGEGILQRDSAPAFYAYRMTAPGGGTTTGVIGALGCDPGGDDVLPHEQTMPKDTSDRLDLLRACRTNLSPIWGLSLSAGVSKTFEPDGPPTAEATDDDGVGHALWVLDDDAVIEAVAAGVGAAPLVIADGHHRYQTALTYQAERRAAGDSGGGYHSIMALVVELSEDQLAVGPIHRTLSGLPADLDLAETFGEWFDIVHVGPADPTLVDAVADSEALALVTAADLWLLTPRGDLHRRGIRPRLQSGGARRQPDPRGDDRVPPRLARGRRRRERRRGRGGGAHPPGDRRPDRRLGPRPPADAPQEHLLPPEAAHRDGLPRPRQLRNWGGAATPQPQRAGCALMPHAPPFLYPPTGIGRPACRLGSVYPQTYRRRGPRH